MYLEKICILISSLSFFAYCISYFTLPNMKSEFKRFNLEKFGLFTIILQFLGATGLMVGFLYNSILMLASLGLSLLMFSGLLVRIRLKDSILVCLPAFFYMILNAFIFWRAIN
tara:strand:+ start:829 stop:1167 length:339 start_codon:yes stop_codon:yes gene_type:complete